MSRISNPCKAFLVVVCIAFGMLYIVNRSRLFVLNEVSTDKSITYDPELDEPNAKNTISYTPHIILNDESGVAYYDGIQFFDASVQEHRRSQISINNALLRDYAIIRGDTYLFVSSAKLNLVSDTTTGDTREYSTTPDVFIRSAVIDTARERVFTLGVGDTLADKSDKAYRVALKHSVLRMRDLEGRVLAAPYRFPNVCGVLARDRFCDMLVVGSFSGDVHVFRTTEDGFHPLLHRTYRIGGVTGASCLGNTIAVSFDCGIRVFRIEGSTVINEFMLPADVKLSEDVKWYDKSLQSSIVSDQWAACSIDKVLYCVNLSTMNAEREVEFPGVIRGLCRAVNGEHEVAVLFDPISSSKVKAACIVWTVDLSTGSVNQDILQWHAGSAAGWHGR